MLWEKNKWRSKMKKKRKGEKNETKGGKKRRGQGNVMGEKENGEVK